MNYKFETKSELSVKEKAEQHAKIEEQIKYFESKGGKIDKIGKKTVADLKEMAAKMRRSLRSAEGKY